MSVISSSNLEQYPDLITKSVNGYSFTRELVNNVNNFDFKQSAYNTLSGTNDTDMSYIWTALSNIAENPIDYDDKTIPPLMYQNISETFEEDILNYIDNVSNIDLCKVVVLQSLISQLGINYTIFDKLQLIPIQLKHLIDILSIKKEYLVNSDKINPLFAKLLYSRISSDNNVASDLSTIAIELTKHRLSAIISTDNEDYPLSSIDSNLVVNTSAYIDNDKLYDFTYQVYKNVLSNFCSLPYNGKQTSGGIYHYLSDNILLSDFALFNTNYNEVEDLNIYRLLYNIPKTFDEALEMDNIENGISTYDDYSIHEQYLLSAEKSYRDLPLSSAALYSRYYYYRYVLVKNFFKFVENEYANYLSLYLSTEQYNINNSYIVVTNNLSNSLLSTDDNGKVLGLKENMIDYVAKALADITESIRNIRELIKSLVQKNFLKGTKLHIAHLIREYIQNNVYPIYNKLITTLYDEISDELTDKNLSDYYHSYETSDVIISVNEYIDPTEYYNISTDIDSISDNVYLRYWQNEQMIRAVAPFNSNNIFKKPNIINSATKTKFTLNEISNFYLNILQMQFESISDETSAKTLFIKDQNNKLSDFLNNIYNTGADNTYLDILNNICCNLDFDKYDKIISELPKNKYQEILNDINILSVNLTEDKNVLTILEKYTSSLDNLSNMTVESYNMLLKDLEEALAQEDKTLSDLDISGISVDIDNNDIAWREYKEKLFKKYSGTNAGSYSFYNIKNIRHPSYLIHSYIKNFVTEDLFDYPIDNIANITTEKITRYLFEKTNKYIDDYGYLKNIWNNDINVNSDYLSEYEKSDNKSKLNVVLKLIDYDGLFYPEAIEDFLLPDFINSLITTPCTNKWYKDLGLSPNELSNIANQLSVFRDLITKEISSAHDIYRYGKDLYGNMYILVKDYGITNITDLSSVDDETKFSTAGIVWMRKKNHPIAFPMLSYDKDSLKPSATTMPNASLIQYIDDDLTNLKSNTKFKDFKLSAIPNDTSSAELSSPLIYDFYISKDKTEFLFLGNDLKNTTSLNNLNYIIHANIKTKYFKNLKLNRYYLTLDSNNTLKYADTSDGFKILNNYSFNSFYSFDSYIGIIETNICVNKNDHILCCNIAIPYWNKNNLANELLQQNLKTCLTCENCADDADIDCKIDVTNTKRLTIAYRNNILSLNTLSVNDYLGKKLDYKDIPNEFNDLHIFKNSVSTREFKFDKKLFVEVLNEKRDYLPYNDLGFIPIYTYKSLDNQYINDISSDNNNQDGWYYDIKVKNQLKFSLIGPPASDNGIFFKRILPVRIHEEPLLSVISSILPNTYNNNFSAVNFFNVKYSEELSNIQYIKDALTNIYEQIDFEKAIDYNNLSARIDESYFNTFTNSTLTSKFDLFKRFPILETQNATLLEHVLNFKDDVFYLWKSNKKYDSYNELYKPGINNTITAQTQSTNTYVIKLTPTYTDSNYSCDQISVSWIPLKNNIYGGKLGIKLDFNTTYYNTDLYQDGPNYFNWKHSFLNLDKPGDAGYLLIWHKTNDNKYKIPGSIYWIKNISDSKPKFILSLIDDVHSELSSTLYSKYYLAANNENELTYINVNSNNNNYTLAIKNFKN